MREPSRRDRSQLGASATEYGLLISGVAALLVIVVVAFGGTVVALFDNTCRSVTSRTGGDCE
ncbi:MAG: Flp family type IVb pilin [Nocardioides sp.]|nr:Flp family type IVb pilin [Nocardioides sp.]